MVEKKNKMTLVVLSGDMDKVMAAYIIASGAAAGGMEVIMFFTFWGLKAIQRDGVLTGKGLFGRMLGVMNRGGLNAIGPSRLNLGGIALGVKLIPCDMSMKVMEIDCEHLIPEVEEPVGVAVMLEHANESSVQYFI